MNKENIIREYSEKAYVVTAICDSAASEYFDANTSSIDSVKNYSENACEIVLTDEEAEKVLKACLQYNDLNDCEVHHLLKNLSDNN